MAVKRCLRFGGHTELFKNDKEYNKESSTAIDNESNIRNNFEIIKRFMNK